MTDRLTDAADDRGTDSTNHTTSTATDDRTDADAAHDSGAIGPGRTRRSLLSMTGVGLAGTVSGCLTNPWGPKNESSDDQTASNSEQTASDSDVETDTSSDSDEKTDAPLDREPAQVVAVAPDGFQFDPGSFTIDAGETVHWRWMDGGHNLRVRSKPEGSDWEGTPGTASDTYDEGYEHGHTFETPGEYTYFCAPHQTLGLEGAFTVR